MYIDPIVVQYPENLEKDRYVIATYYAAIKPSNNALKFSAAVAVEQTCGTWIRLPGETDEVRSRSIGKVIGIYETPAYEIGIPSDINERHLIIRIAYPYTNFGSSFAMLMSSVIGEISSSGKIKLLDLEFPDTFLKSFKGPKFGVQGIRDLLSVQDRPLLINMIKPCTGLTPKETAKLAYDAALGGVDLLKDDELMANPPYCPFSERVKYVMEALEKADQLKGEKTLYALNITDRTEKLKENALLAIENGANCLMVSYNTIGLDAARMLAEDPAINVPILAHSNFSGALCESPWNGVSNNLIGATLPRLAGLDMIIILTPYGKFPVQMDKFISTCYKMVSPLGHIKPAFPLPGGGTMPGHIEDMIQKFGNDVVIAAGGAIHSHPMGATAGARAFRQGIDEVISGVSLAEAGKKHKELGIALDAWGIYKEERSGIFDLKG